MAYNVLLVDDSATTRKIIAKTLRITGVPVNEFLEAGNGQEALDLLAEHWVDLVIADINMPVMDGLELVARMADDGLLKSIPVVACSSQGSALTVDELKAKGVRAYVRKPITPDQLHQVVEEVLGERAATPDEGPLGQVFQEVLERFAYMVAEPADPAALPPVVGPVTSASTHFAGPSHGTLTIAAPFAWCAEMAVDSMGDDREDPDAGMMADDALQELLNMTCARLLTALGGVNTMNEMSPPASATLEEADWQALVAEDGVRAFLCNGQPVLLRLVQEA